MGFLKSKFACTNCILDNNYSNYHLKILGNVFNKNVTLTAFSEALILASINPQYNKRLFIELQDMKMASSEHVENMLRACCVLTQIAFCSHFDIQDNCSEFAIFMY